jgi:hypothetical protein
LQQQQPQQQPQPHMGGGVGGQRLGQLGGFPDAPAPGGGGFGGGGGFAPTPTPPTPGGAGSQTSPPGADAGNNPWAMRRWAVGEIPDAPPPQQYIQW